MEAHNKSPDFVKRLKKVKVPKGFLYRDALGNLYEEDGTYLGLLGFPEGKPVILKDVPLTAKEAAELMKGKGSEKRRRYYDTYLDYLKKLEGKEQEKEAKEEKAKETKEKVEGLARFMGYLSVADFQREVPDLKQRGAMIKKYAPLYEESLKMPTESGGVSAASLVTKTTEGVPKETGPMVSDSGAASSLSADLAKRLREWKKGGPGTWELYAHWLPVFDAKEMARYQEHFRDYIIGYQPIQAKAYTKSEFGHMKAEEVPNTYIAVLYSMGGMNAYDRNGFFKGIVRSTKGAEGFRTFGAHYLLSYDKKPSEVEDEQVMRFDEDED